LKRQQSSNEWLYAADISDSDTPLKLERRELEPPEKEERIKHERGRRASRLQRKGAHSTAPARELAMARANSVNTITAKMVKMEVATAPVARHSAVATSYLKNQRFKQGW
jgi:hypothetical protein